MEGSKGREAPQFSEALAEQSGTSTHDVSERNTVHNGSCSKGVPGYKAKNMAEL